jgi:hypothetical protein
VRLQLPEMTNTRLRSASYERVFGFGQHVGQSDKVE